jgi:molecular chaperone GrpE
LAKAKKNEAPEEKPLDAEVVDVAADETPEAWPQNELETALAAEKDKYLRLAAEYDNYRKRSIKEREALYADIRSETIVRILPVYDNLTRALKLECSDEAFYKGVELTMTQLKDILDKMGVTEIPAVGMKFDPERHNAVMHVEDPEAGEGVIVEEFEKGFILGEKVIRFSMVKVAN